MQDKAAGRTADTNQAERLAGTKADRKGRFNTVRLAVPGDSTLRTLQRKAALDQTGPEPKRGPVYMGTMKRSGTLRPSRAQAMRTMVFEQTGLELPPGSGKTGFMPSGEAELGDVALGASTLRATMALNAMPSLKPYGGAGAPRRTRGLQSALSGAPDGHRPGTGDITLSSVFNVDGTRNQLLAGAERFDAKYVPPRLVSVCCHAQDGAEPHIFLSSFVVCGRHFGHMVVDGRFMSADSRLQFGHVFSDPDAGPPVGLSDSPPQFTGMPGKDEELFPFNEIAHNAQRKIARTWLHFKYSRLGSVLRIQAVMRGFMVRRGYRRNRILGSAAAQRIQAVARGRGVRRGIQFKRYVELLCGRLTNMSGCQRCFECPNGSARATSRR